MQTNVSTNVNKVLNLFMIKSKTCVLLALILVKQKMVISVMRNVQMANIGIYRKLHVSVAPIIGRMKLMMVNHAIIIAYMTNPIIDIKLLVPYLEQARIA